MKFPLPKLLLSGVLACIAFGIAPARAANILIVAGTNANAQTAASAFNIDLTGGNTVTVVNTGVPVSLTGYTQIFDVRYDDSPDFSSGEKTQYLAFLNAAPGNALFLMGESSDFNVRNTPINNFISLAGGGTIASPTTYSLAVETVNPPFTGPNMISTVQFSGCGFVTSPGSGSFASSEAGGGCSIYFAAGSLQNAPHGALVVVYDTNFAFSAPTGGAMNEIPFRKNLEQFLSSPPAIPTVNSVSPGSGSPSGGNSVTITGTGFTGTSGVTFGGVAAASFTVNSDTSITAQTPPGMAGQVSVLVTTPIGANSANMLYTYSIASPPPLQISVLGPVTLQVVANESLLTSGTATLVANQGGYTWLASTATPWLALTLASCGFPGVGNITANATGLAVGSYNGTITVTAGNQTLTVPVTLTVLAPASLTAVPNAISLAGEYPGGSATGYNVQIGPSGVAFSARTSSYSSGWLSITPTSGIGPAVIHLVVDATKLTPGTYQDSIVITSPGSPNSPFTIPVRLSVSGFFSALPQQVNSASGTGPDHTVAPNEIVSLYLSSFACAVQPVVSINGTPVTWSSYTPGQINYAVPATLTQPSALSVACNGVTEWSFNGLSVAATVPGIFTLATTGKGSAAAVNGVGTIMNSSNNAAARGSYISVYVTGFGVFSPVSADGLRRLAGTVTAQIGGVDATVQYAGEAPGNTDGLQQINILVPANSPVGDTIPVTLWVSGTPAQVTATIPVR